MLGLLKALWVNGLVFSGMIPSEESTLVRKMVFLTLPPRNTPTCFCHGSTERDRIPKSGSFLRVKKVETGLNFLTALREKYVTQNQDSEDMLLKLGANDVEVETVGWQKVASKQR